MMPTDMSRAGIALYHMQDAVNSTQRLEAVLNTSLLLLSSAFVVTPASTCCGLCDWVGRRMGIRQALHAVPVILLTILGNAHCASLNIRGLDPSLAEYYKQSGDSFKCLDGQRMIKYGLINDNYCDCLDGSDEPGEPLITISLESILVNWRLNDKSALLLLLQISPHFAVIRLNHTSTVLNILWRSW